VTVYAHQFELKFLKVHLAVAEVKQTTQRNYRHMHLKGSRLEGAVVGLQTPEPRMEGFTQTRLLHILVLLELCACLHSSFNKQETSL
jgi:hypothetical protein